MRKLEMSRLWHPDWLTHYHGKRRALFCYGRIRNFWYVVTAFIELADDENKSGLVLKTRHKKAISLIIFISTKQCNFIAKRMFPQSTIYVFLSSLAPYCAKMCPFQKSWSTRKREMDIDDISTYWPSSSANNSKATEHSSM